MRPTEQITIDACDGGKNDTGSLKQALKTFWLVVYKQNNHLLMLEKNAVIPVIL